MPAANTDKLRKKKSFFQTTLNGGISAVDTSLTLNSASGLPTDTAVTLIINRVDANGDATPSLREIVTGTVSGSVVSNLLRGEESISAKSHLNGAVVEMTWDAETWNDFVDAYLTEHNQDGTHKPAALSATIVTAAAKTTPVNADSFGIVDSEASNVLKELTFTNLKAFLKTYFDTLYATLTGNQTFSGTNLFTGNVIGKFLLEEGAIINGRILPADASGLTLALKTFAGTDPSASDPVYAVINGVARSITAALSVAKADGTNWCNSGSAELAAKEVDYFAYLGYNATDGVVIGFSRFPDAKQYSDFSVTTTDEKYCAISTITNAAATDYYAVIGRFAATLSAGAGYTWTVPTFTAINLIQKPIYETRWLTFAPTLAGWSANPTIDWAQYRVQRSTLNVSIGSSSGTSNATTATFTLPWKILNYPTGTGLGTNAGVILTTPIKFGGTPASATITLYKDCSNAAWTNSGTKNFLFENIILKI